MKEAESKVGLVPCACWGDHITLSWPKCGLFMALLSSFIGAGLLFPYLIIVIRKIMPSFLPLISNAGGVPPSNGVFAVCILFGAFFGFITFHLIFQTINHRNVKDNNYIRKFNKIAYIVALLSCFGIVMVACFPVGYTDVPNMFEWVTTVLFEHGIGATFILVGVSIYQFIIGWIWWVLPDTSKTDKYVKVGFIILLFIFFLITVYPLPAYIFEEFGPNPLDFARFKTISYDLPSVYSTNLIICSVCEYSLCILSLINFLTICKDLQRVSLRLILRPKSCFAEEEPPVPSIQLKVLA